MHLKALSLLFAFLCIVQTFGVLGAPVPNNPPHITSHGQFHHEMANHFAPLIGQHKAALAAQDAQHLQFQHAHPNQHSPTMPPAFPQHLEHPDHLGHGLDGIVFRAGAHHTVTHPAVVKVVLDPHGIHHEAVTQEVHNLKQVKQYLGHGYDSNSKTHYIVQKNMGGPLPPSHAHLTEEDLAPHHEEALARYRTHFGMQHDDVHPQNFVHGLHPDGSLKTEVIDWRHAIPCRKGGSCNTQ